MDLRVHFLQYTKEANMSMDQAAMFLAGSIITGLGFIIVFIVIVIINNILHQYWKPIKWLRIMDHPMYVSREELVEPEIKNETKKS
jgi:hypothetical protein